MPAVVQMPSEEKFDPEKLERLIQAAEQVEKTFTVLPDDIRFLYHKQRSMLLNEIKEEIKKSVTGGALSL